MKYAVIVFGTLLSLLGLGAIFLWFQEKNAFIGILVMMLPAGVWLIWQSRSMTSISLKDIKGKKPENEPNSIVWYAKKADDKPVADRVEFVYVANPPGDSRPRSVRNLGNVKYHYLRNQPGTETLETVILPDKKYLDPRIFVRAITMPARTAFHKYIKDEVQTVPMWLLVGMAGLLLLGLLIIP